MIDSRELKELLKKKKMEGYEVEIGDELDSVIKKTLSDKIREIKNKKRIIANDNAKEHELAKDVFSEEEISSFPRWIRDNIDDAQVIGGSKNVIQIKNGKKYHIKNKVNDLSGGEWTFFLNSVINTRYSTNGEEGYAHHIRKIHPSPKPPQLMKSIIEFFTKENDLIKLIKNSDDVFISHSNWNDKILVRIVAKDAYNLKILQKKLILCFSDNTLPKVWNN